MSASPPAAPETRPLDAHWRRWAVERPEVLALSGDVPDTTYAQLEAGIEGARGFLARHGVGVARGRARCMPR